MFRMIVSFCFVSGSGAIALAADARQPIPYYPAPPAYAQPPAQPQAFDWGRCYIGAQAGIKDVQNRTDLSDTAFYKGQYVDKVTTNLLGPVVGGQVGCNKMLDNGFLVGVELEGVLGYKNQQECQTQIDPMSYCFDVYKRHEAFATVRFGYTFNCNCENGGTLVYGRIGAGYTNTDMKMNVNANSYLYVAEANTAPPPDGYGPDKFRPMYAQNYDLAGSKSFISPVLGFGIERALDKNWTIRGDFTSMLSMASRADLTVNKINFLTPNGTLDPAGATLDRDYSTIARNPRLGDRLPIKVREVETKITVGVNRLF